MSSKEFVQQFYIERKQSIDSYFQKGGESQVSILIEALKLGPDGEEKLKKILYNAFGDLMYGILLGLCGDATIGTIQQDYEVIDEDGNELTDDMADFAWEYFQNREDEY